MNKLNLVGVFFVTMLLLVICNQNSKSADNTKIVKNEVDSSNSGNDFESFQANFKPLGLDNLKELGEQFNSHYLANDNSLIEVSQIFKERYLNSLNTKYLYYGFITKLPSKSLILTFLKHYGAENIRNGEVIDTTFFVSLVFSDSGKFQSSFRSFGSNLTGEPPTYNMTSTFEYEENRLFITNYEYSTGKSYAEAELLPGSDSIYQADLLITKYCLNYNTNVIVITNKIKSKSKVVETYHNQLPVYLRPLTPSSAEAIK